VDARVVATAVAQSAHARCGKSQRNAIEYSLLALRRTGLTAPM